MVLRMISQLRSSAFAFPLAALTALAMFFITETSYQQAKGSLDNLGAVGTARYAIQTLWRNLTNAETGQRGFLLTDRKEYLQPYTSSLDDVERSLVVLSRYYANDPVGGPIMARAETLSREKLSELATTLALHAQGKDEAWRSMTLSNIGKEKMDAVAALLDRLAQLESAKVEVGRRSVYQTLLLNRIGVTAMTALSLLALFMYLRQTTALIKQREALAESVKADREHLESEVKARTTLLTELAQHLQTIREDERSHLARELHDELGALLTAAKLDVARLKSRLGAMTPEVSERLQHLNEALNSGIALKRRIIEDLRPSSLSNLGLVAALTILTDEFNARYGAEMHTMLEPVRLSPAGELTVYRLVQEALTNVAKYAKATVIHVTLESSQGEVRVEVRDNGVGFDVKAKRAAAHGLIGMRYRVEAEGGRMQLRSTPGAGTAIEACLPETVRSKPEREAAEQS